jgi:hypothetical protein
VLEAYKELYEKYSHLIVKGFEQVGLSLNPNVKTIGSSRFEIS